MSREKLLIIDGSSYLYRAFYASGGLTTSTGFPTGAIFWRNIHAKRSLEQKQS